MVNKEVKLMKKEEALGKWEERIKQIRGALRDKKGGNNEGESHE